EGGLRRVRVLVEEEDDGLRGEDAVRLGVVPGGEVRGERDAGADGGVAAEAGDAVDVDHLAVTLGEGHGEGDGGRQRPPVRLRRGGGVELLGVRNHHSAASPYSGVLRCCRAVPATAAAAAVERTSAGPWAVTSNATGCGFAVFGCSMVHVNLSAPYLFTYSSLAAWWGGLP